MSTVLKKKEDAYLVSAIIWTGTSYAMNEILSIGNSLNYKCMLMTYIGLIVVLIVAISYQIIKKKYRSSFDLQWYVQKDKSERILLVTLGLFMVFMLAMSIVSIPYDVDSLTYHLTRIAYWTQNESVAHFATNDVRAVTSPPLAEFINLHVYILGGESDLFCNVLQMASYATNAYLVWGISKKLIIPSKYRYLSVLLYISTPIAFAEALTTQVDQFAAMWVMLFAYFIFDLLEPDFRFELSKEVISKVLILGACIAFGYLSKPTGLFAMFVFAVWLLFACIKRKERIRNLVVLIGIAVAEIVLIVAPEMARNFFTFNSFSASSVGTKHMVDTFNPIYLLLNFMKNLSVNLPNIYIPWFSRLVQHGVCWIAYICGIDINDPRIAHDGVEYIVREPQRYIQDSAVNPIILYFTAFAVLVLIIKWFRKEKDNMLDAYSWTAIVSFLALCFILKYELYSTRYMIGYLGLLCPMIAGQLAGIKCKRQYEIKIIISTLIVFMCFVELMALAKHHAKIWYKHLTAEDRIEGYLEYRQKDEVAYRQLGEYLSQKDYDDLGVYLYWGAGEYPIWKLVDEAVRIEAVNVTNETAVYMDEEFVPEYIVVKGVEADGIENYMGRKYCLEEVFDEKIYLYALE